MSLGPEVITIFALSFLVGLSGAASPGPLIVLNIRESIRHGFIAGPYIATGHSLLELIMVILLSLGLEKLLMVQGIPSAIAFSGGGFLLYMSWGILKNPKQGSLLVKEDYPREKSNQPARLTILSGALVTLGNPFWFVWWLTIGVTMLTRSSIIGSLGSVVFYFGHILADYSCSSLISFTISTGRRFLTIRIYGYIMIGCAIFLTLIGIYFIFSGSVQLITTLRS